MARSVYVSVRVRGYTFVFKRDPACPELLHIYARHLTEPADAISAIFVGATIWNEAHRRYESRSDTHVTYWFWRDEVNRVIMVITCYKQLQVDRAQEGP